MIARTLSTRLVLGPLVGIAGFAFAIASTSTASAQGDAPAAGSAAPPAATTATPPATGTAPAPASSAEDPSKKAPPAPSSSVTGPTPVTAAPGQVTATPTADTSSGTTVSFGAGPKKDEPSKGGDKKDEKLPPLNPLAGSLFLFDQSATTNSFKKSSQLSYVPEYEWWLSPRVYYNITRQFKVGVRQDVFKEWTNAEETTHGKEWRVGDTWLTASYADKLKFITEKLRGSVGWTVRPGISKESRGAGQYLATGPSASLTFGYDITGEKGKVFKTGTVGASVSFSKAFTRCTTACKSDFSQPRQTSTGEIVDSDQVRSGSLTGSTFLYALNAGLEITDQMSFGVSQIWFTNFLYGLSDAQIRNGDTLETVPTSALDTRIRQFSWFLVSLDYEVVKEVGLSLGYYNLANVIAPDGKYRQPFWSPEARVFFSVEFKIDAIYDRFNGKKEEKPTTAQKKTSLFSF
ncbi:MAG: hypothetical protein ACXVEF_30800 [Polyangiales bacterium]